MTTLTTTLLGYQSALDNAAYYIHPNPGYLRISGKDRVDFLQRQTTNDMALLVEGRVLPNVLTTPAARILDVFQLMQDSDAIGAITLPGKNEATTKFLTSKIFFMDKVEVTDASQEIALVDIEGPDAKKVLENLGLEEELEIGQVKNIPLGKISVRMIAQKGLTTDIGYRLFLPKDALDLLLSKLEDSGVSPLSEDSYETLRVEAGRPNSGSELNENYTPLETNLRAAISDSKGCYTGQEVIARQITYDKITKQLVQLRLDSAVEVGATVLANGKKAGVATSVADSPRLGKLALAVLKRPHEADGTQITVAKGDEFVAGTVKNLTM